MNIMSIEIPTIVGDESSKVNPITFLSILDISHELFNSSKEKWVCPNIEYAFKQVELL